MAKSSPLKSLRNNLVESKEIGGRGGLGGGICGLVSCTARVTATEPRLVDPLALAPACLFRTPTFTRYCEVANSSVRTIDVWARQSYSLHDKQLMRLLSTHGSEGIQRHRQVAQRKVRARSHNPSSHTSSHIRQKRDQTS